jgi:hypothetical protein
MRSVSVVVRCKLSNFSPWNVRNDLSTAPFRASRIADAASRKWSYNLALNPILDEIGLRGLRNLYGSYIEKYCHV